jgi:uncharacterized protein
MQIRNPKIILEMTRILH